MATDAEQAGAVDAADIVSDWYGGPADEADTHQTERNSGKHDEWPDEGGSQSGGGNDTEPEKMREADQSFTLKHLGQVRSVSRDEVIALAQKGLDYDRQRQKNEELLSKKQGSVGRHWPRSDRSAGNGYRFRQYNLRQRSPDDAGDGRSETERRRSGIRRGIRRRRPENNSGRGLGCCQRRETAPACLPVLGA